MAIADYIWARSPILATIPICQCVHDSAQPSNPIDRVPLLHIALHTAFLTCLSFCSCRVMASLRRFWLLVSSELFESDCFDPADPKQPIADQGAHQQVAPPSGDVSGDSAPRASPFRASLAEVRLFDRIRRRRRVRLRGFRCDFLCPVHRRLRRFRSELFVLLFPRTWRDSHRAPSNYYCCCFYSR